MKRPPPTNKEVVSVDTNSTVLSTPDDCYLHTMAAFLKTVRSWGGLFCSFSFFMQLLASATTITNHYSHTLVVQSLASATAITNRLGSTVTSSVKGNDTEKLVTEPVKPGIGREFVADHAVAWLHLREMNTQLCTK